MITQHLSLVPSYSFSLCAKLMLTLVMIRSHAVRWEFRKHILNKWDRCVAVYSVPDSLSCQLLYPTLKRDIFSGAEIFTVRSPSLEEHNFDDPSLDSQYNVLKDDIAPAEIAFGREKERHNRSRINKFLGGRIALRRSIVQLNHKPEHPNSFEENNLKLPIDIGPIVSNPVGAPSLPPFISGSISHKDDICVGAACWQQSGRVGVDIERCTNKAALTLARRIITSAERTRLGTLEGILPEEEILLRFSFKEAIYKAIHPYLQRSIDFSEVEVDPHPDGSANVKFQLKTGESFDCSSRWQRFNEMYWLTYVHVQLL